MRRWSSLLAAALFLTAVPASAAMFRAGKDLTLAAPVTNDLYVASETLDVGGDVTGDLFAAGGDISVHDRVTQSVFLAGRTISVQSQIGDDLRVAGGTVVVRGVVGGDLIVFGGTVTIGKDALILGDVIINGGTVDIRGTVTKALTVNAGSVILEGIVHGGVTANAGAILVSGPIDGKAKLTADGITIKDGAAFHGSVDYGGGGTVNFGNSLVNGQKPTFHPEYHRTQQATSRANAFSARLLGVFSIFHLLSVALVLFLLLVSTRTFFSDAAKILLKKPWKSFFTGIGFFFLTPIATVVLFLTMIGISVALALIAAYALLLIFSIPLSAMILTRFAETHFGKKWNRYALYGISFGMLLALEIIGTIPRVGFTVMGLIVLTCVGALLITKAAKWKKWS